MRRKINSEFYEESRKNIIDNLNNFIEDADDDNLVICFDQKFCLNDINLNIGYDYTEYGFQILKILQKNYKIPKKLTKAVIMKRDSIIQNAIKSWIDSGFIKSNNFRITQSSVLENYYVFFAGLYSFNFPDKYINYLKSAVKKTIIGSIKHFLKSKCPISLYLLSGNKDTVLSSNEACSRVTFDFNDTLFPEKMARIFAFYNIDMNFCQKIKDKFKESAIFNIKNWISSTKTDDEYNNYRYIPFFDSNDKTIGQKTEYYHRIYFLIRDFSYIVNLYGEEVGVYSEDVVKHSHLLAGLDALSGSNYNEEDVEIYSLYKNDAMKNTGDFFCRTYRLLDSNGKIVPKNIAVLINAIRDDGNNDLADQLKLKFMLKK
jgi:hypothetical protein